MYEYETGKRKPPYDRFPKPTIGDFVKAYQPDIFEDISEILKQRKRDLERNFAIYEIAFS